MKTKLLNRNRFRFKNVGFLFSEIDLKKKGNLNIRSPSHHRSFAVIIYCALITNAFPKPDTQDGPIPSDFNNALCISSNAFAPTSAEV